LSFSIAEDEGSYPSSGATNSSTIPTLSRQGRKQTNVGLLIVNCQRKIVSLNRNFIELWNLPKYLISRTDDEQALEFASKEFEDPEGFLEGIRELYRHPNFVVNDTIKFKDGKIFERYSCPIFEEEKIVGRLWEFMS